MVYTKPVDGSSLLSILKTIDYESLGSYGKIHWIDFRNAVQRYATISSDDLLKVFNDIDLDRDQYITHNEYRIWINKLNSMLLDQIIKAQKPKPQPVQPRKPAERPKVGYKINTGNVNGVGNGYNNNVDTASLLSFLKTLNAKSLDTNNDNTIQYSEMVQYFKRFYGKPMREDHIKKIFYDINNNMNYGRVDLDKFNAWVGRLNSLHLEKILKGSATGSGNYSPASNSSPKVKYHGANDPNKDNYASNNYNNSSPKVKYYNSSPQNYDNGNNNEKPKGYQKPFSLSQQDIIDLMQILQNLNIRSLDYGNTSTVQLGTFENYFKGLNRAIPSLIVTKIWNAIDYQRIGRIAVGEYQRFVHGLSEEKLKGICGN